MIKKYLSHRFVVSFLIALLLVVLISAGSAQALMIKMNLEDLSTESDTIIIGTVVNTKSHWDTEQGNIYTSVAVSTENSLKGEGEPDLVTVIVPGGTVDGITQIVSDTPVFKPGEEVVLFLNKLPWDTLSLKELQPHFYELCGNFQGKAKIEDNRVFGVSVDQFKEELNSIIDNESASFSIYPVPEEPEYVENQFVTLPFRWPGLSPVVPYYVNASLENTNHITSAAGTWSNAGANFTYSYEGPHYRSGGAFSNGINEIMGAYFNSTALAIATIWEENGFIKEADMTFNLQYNWGSDYDFQTVALHEFGHWVGLNHCNVSGSIMFNYYMGAQRTLHQVDIDGVKYIYGEASVIVPCTVDSPTIPSGPTSGEAGVSNTYTTSDGYCSNDHPLQYQYQFGDETQSNWRSSPDVNKTWNNPGTYQVQVRTRCSIEIDTVSPWSLPLDVVITTTAMEHSLAISVEGQGTTIPAAGTHSITEGTLVTLTATPAEGWLFEKWIINTVAYTESTVNFTLNEATNAKAVFTEKLPQQPEDNDNETGDQDNTNESGTNPPSSPDPSPDPAPVSSSPTTTPIYVLTVAAEGEGFTVPAPGGHSYVEGSEIALSASPAAGWRFKKWIVNGEIITSVRTTLILENDVQATAYFIKLGKGDINGDDNVNVADVAMVIRYSLGLDTLTEGQLIRADVNDDGVVDVLDVTLIMRHALGLINSL